MKLAYCKACHVNRAYARGLCSACYQAVRKYGEAQLPRIVAKTCERCGKPRKKNRDGKGPPPGLCLSCHMRDTMAASTLRKKAKKNAAGRS